MNDSSYDDSDDDSDDDKQNKPTQGNDIEMVSQKEPANKTPPSIDKFPRHNRLNSTSSCPKSNLKDPIIP